MNKIVFDDWLAVSTDGFASMNAGREPAHLVKELAQNALDALGDDGGEVELDCRPGERPDAVAVTCRDDGCGVADLAEIRTVFHTTKTDSHLKRGRMARGFKEMLCVALAASVESGGRTITFATENDRRVTRLGGAAGSVHRGTTVRMEMPWDPAAVIPGLEAYFRRLLPPAGVVLRVNGSVVPHRRATRRVEATLPTELFEAGRWVRPPRRTVVELVPVATAADDEDTDAGPFVYELGIPVCPAGWTLPYHADVRQRVPMNPCRDAVAAGYLQRLHQSCLSAVLAEMGGEQVREDWVGAAVDGEGGKGVKTQEGWDSPGTAGGFSWWSPCSGGRVVWVCGSRRAAQSGELWGTWLTRPRRGPSCRPYAKQSEGQRPNVLARKSSLTDDREWASAGLEPIC